jgi:hypothetical protein
MSVLSISEPCDLLQGGILLGYGGGGYGTQLVLVLNGDCRGQIWVCDNDSDDGLSIFPLSSSLWSSIRYSGPDFVRVLRHAAGMPQLDTVQRCGLGVDDSKDGGGIGGACDGCPPTGHSSLALSTPPRGVEADGSGDLDGGVPTTSFPPLVSPPVLPSAKHHLTMFTVSEPCESTRALLGRLVLRGVGVSVVYAFRGTSVSVHFAQVEDRLRWVDRTCLGVTFVVASHRLTS